MYVRRAMPTATSKPEQHKLSTETGAMQAFAVTEAGTTSPHSLLRWYITSQAREYCLDLPCGRRCRAQLSLQSVDSVALTQEQWQDLLGCEADVIALLRQRGGGLQRVCNGFLVNRLHRGVWCSLSCHAAGACDAGRAGACHPSARVHARTHAYAAARRAGRRRAVEARAWENRSVVE